MATTMMMMMMTVMMTRTTKATDANMLTMTYDIDRILFHVSTPLFSKILIFPNCLSSLVSHSHHHRRHRAHHHYHHHQHRRRHRRHHHHRQLLTCPLLHASKLITFAVIRQSGIDENSMQLVWGQKKRNNNHKSETLYDPSQLPASVTPSLLPLQLQQGRGAEGTVGAEAPPFASNLGERASGKVALRPTDWGTQLWGQEAQERGKSSIRCCWWCWVIIILVMMMMMMMMMMWWWLWWWRWVQWL